MNLSEVRDIATIVTPFIILIIGVCVIPLLVKIRRSNWLQSTKIDCIIHANKNLNGQFKDWAKDWGKKYDEEFSSKVGEKKFIEGK